VKGESLFVEHRKHYQSQEITNHYQHIVIEGPVSPEALKTLQMEAGLNAFRQPKEQHEALIDISGLPEGRVIIARANDTILGYVTFHYPDELERWSDGGMLNLIELGAVEVAPAYRSLGLG